MAAIGWRAARPLSVELREHCAQFDFYQLVRLLLIERNVRDASAAVDRHVRFRADLSLAFPANEVTAVAEADRLHPIVVSTPNYSVAGYLGPLPETLTEWLLERKASGDRAMSDFLDLFNHRIGTLRYRIKARTYPALNRQSPEDTPQAARLSAVIGLLPAGLAEQLPLPKRALLGLAGLLANRRRNADTLERVVARFLDTPVLVVPLRGTWRSIPADDHTYLAKRNHRLGENAVLGQQTWDQAARIDVRIGPLPYERWRELLPGGERHAALAVLLRFLTDRQVDCRVRLLTPSNQVPTSTLSSTSRAARVGRIAWLGTTQHGLRETTFIVSAYSELAHAA